MDAQPGRRERKKAATRKAISNAATELFLERGFDNVSIREIADKADVSPTTVFAHFPQKEALVFDEDDEQRDELVAAVRDRAEGTSILQALHAHYRAGLLEHGDRDDQVKRFWALVDSTPALSEYAQRMWIRYEDALAQAIADDRGIPEPTDEQRAFSRFALQVQNLIAESPRPFDMLDASFAILERGWLER
ncbi:TetR/AcrR family transcriptional regulator [Salinibacterium soli]|uniref:TetR family transcriptional regulator n=1 Tax=Antiquaquibacter soli TaxID=3064523 RepID=A0ABT9BID6_9MICO|nr:TetR/AcrR family transcriptional regulator [Protaetiibacter sp. WY-16]MDO7880784.1 TetR family transcriptional regulator [Protaetiibacter sp. WY-16]